MFEGHHVVPHDNVGGIISINSEAPWPTTVRNVVESVKQINKERIKDSIAKGEEEDEGKEVDERKEVG